MLNRWLAVTLVACPTALSGCVENGNGTPPPAPQAAKATSESAAVTPPFHARLLEIARTYPSYGRVDGRNRWAPVGCAPATLDPLAPPARFSASKDAGTHGRKLYFVFARHSEDGVYHAAGKPSPVGQVVVKESWLPEEVKADGNATDAARKDGRLYRAGRKGDLFVMYKLDPATPGTDLGWVYGTVTADGKTVTSAGRVQSCMKCHLKAPHDRLFGLPPE